MIKIFISYARADDEPFVKQLYQDLTEQGFDIWWDRKAMDSRGLTFLQEIRDAIEGSDRLIAVIGPHAVKSDYVKVEWEHGLLFAKSIVPILRLGDFDQIPGELSKFHCPDFRKERPCKDALDELVRILSEPMPPLGAFNTSVPSLPPHFQSRRDEIAHIGEMVLEDIQRPTAVTSAKQTTAIVGMGGSGKSVLAAAFVRATDTRRAFKDGVIWLQIGQNPDILSSMRLTGTGFKDDAANYVDIERAKASLPKVLGDKVCLIVLDDIWNVNHVAPFRDALGPRCRLLITTRDGGLATGLGAQQHLLGMLTETGAVRFLADWCGKDVSSLPPEAASIAKECGYLPFALALCGAMAQEGNQWSDMMEALNEADLTFIEKQFPNYPYTNVLKSLKISIDALAGEDPEAVKHYQELVVFHNHRSIPEAAIMTLWMHMSGLKERSARKLLVTLNSKALLRLEGEAPDRSVTLHDLQHDYLRATGGDLKNFHEKLLAAYQKKCKEGWAGGPKDGYFFENLAYHLVEAERKDELRRLLFDYGWIHAKLEATDVNSLIKDYDFLPADRDLRLVQGALRLSAHFLAQDKMQLRSQLYGRLMGQEAPEIKVMLEQIRLRKAGVWFRPLAPSLIQSGSSLIRTFECHTGAISAVSLLPDGKRVILAFHDRTLKVWDIESREVLKELKCFPDKVIAVSVLPSGKSMISISDYGALKIWDLESGKILKTLQSNAKAPWLISSINAVSVFPDGKRAISASDDGTLKVWDLENGEVLKILKGHGDKVISVSVLSDGKHAISTSVDRTFKIWDIESGEVQKTFESNIDPANILVLDDGKRAISYSTGNFTISLPLDRALKIWDIESGEVLKTLEGHTERVTAVSLFPDGKHAISASEDGTLKVWDIEMGKETRTLERHTDRVTEVLMLPDGKRAISASFDQTLKVWDIESGKELKTLGGHYDRIFDVSVLSDGKRAISASHDGTLKVWDIESGKELKTLHDDNGPVQSVSMLPDGKRAISGSHDGTLKVWDIENGEELKTLIGHTNGITEVLVLPDGKRVISASHDGTLKIWDIESGEELRTLVGHTGGIEAISMLPDGKRTISASYDGTLRVWDIESGEMLKTFKGHANAVIAVFVLSDGRRAISGSFDHSLKVWDIESGEVLKTLIGHTYFVNSVSLLPDNKRAISASWDHMLKVWDIDRGEVIVGFGGDGTIQFCAASPDGKTIIAGEASGKVHILRLEGAD